MIVSIERLPALLALLAAVTMIGVTSWQGYDIWQTESSFNVEAATTSGAAVPEQRQPPKVELASLDLFGVADQEPDEALDDTENLPETNLRLQLRGVLAAEGEFPGSALIEDDKSDTEVYLVGDELPGKAKLRSVHANRIIIQRNGKLENLYFPELKESSDMALASNTPEPVSRPEPAPQRSRPDASSMSQDERREEVRRRLEELRNRLRNNN